MHAPVISIGMRVEKNKYAVAFGEVLKQLRRKAKLSQDSLAEKAELERTFISFLERGERQPSLTTIIVLANALEKPPTELLKGTLDLLADSSKQTQSRHKK